jgi:putative addiction module component (TIGR02574 family)
VSKVEILAELPNLSAKDLAEVQAKLDELAGDLWLDDGELSDADKMALDAGLAEYHKNPDAGASWEQVEARIRSKFNA